MPSTTKPITRKPRTDITTNKITRTQASRSSKQKPKTTTVKKAPAMVDVQQVSPPPEIDIPNLRFLRRVRREADFGAKREKRQVAKVSENWFATDMELLGIVWDYEVDPDKPVDSPLDRMSFPVICWIG
ncbi:uncharacterized protein FIESC28_04455 [Fusarium coffeatum]|uniref:Uncharacterized protein n=1 Tax=Fusarium coffeatum TaxID=231269 RepID=A0A366RZN0_9HYPO|nr:uncharacterized protein FIESC28_04455 [Fusarium coffeatum]RBR22514.1 hypothetical protein FIESC28_04455 [Fusarium coffeatum]